MSLLNDASLILVPSAIKTGELLVQKPLPNKFADETGNYDGNDPQGSANLTFTRASNASRVNSDGLVEKVRTNLILQSNTFDTTWTLSNASVTGGQSGYDGSNDAWLFETTVAGAAVQQAFTSTGVLTYSVYAKAGSVNGIRLRIDAASDADGFYDLANGTIFSSNGIDASISDVGNGWYRCSISHNVSGPVKVQFFTTDGTGSYDNGNIYIQNAQLETGLVATGYIPTTTSARSTFAGITVDGTSVPNVPRLDYSGGATCPSLLLEPQRTNLVPISEGIPEDENNVTLTENYGTSPEGVRNSLKVQKNGIDGNDRIQPIGNYNATLVSGNDYTISCFVKNIDATNGVTTLACRISGGSLFRSGYDWDGSSLSYLTTGYNAGARENIFVEDYGNNWWRIGFTFEADGTSGNFELDIDRRNGSDTTSIETWGWQLEAGSYATSYIPCYGTSNSRLADAALLNNSAALPTAYPFTLFAECEVTPSDGQALTLSNTASSTEYFTIDFNAGFYRIASRPSTTQDSAVSTLATTLGFHKICGVFTSTTLKLFVDGTLVASGANTQAFNASINDIFIGQLRSVSDTGNRNPVKQALVFKSALSDAQAIELTTL